MPISYLDAKARVCPDGPVTPGSKEHKDILELMRQSGRVFAEENVPERPAPRPARNISDLKPYNLRPAPITRKTMALAKKQWLQIECNRKAYEAHLAEHQTVPVGALEPLPKHLEWSDKIAPKMSGPMSKHAWISQLK